MANTHTLIASSTVGSSGTSNIDFISIPNTYTDLKLLVSARNTTTGEQEFIKIKFNSNTSSYTLRTLQGNGYLPSSETYSQPWAGFAVGTNAVAASLFSNNEIYIPNYNSSEYKSFSVDSVAERNEAYNQLILSANLWSNTAAITSINLSMEGGYNFIQYSNFYLYGIKNS